MAELLSNFTNQLKAAYGDDLLNQIDASLDGRKILTLSGEVETWQQVVDIGHLAGKLPDIKGVVNNITSKDYQKPATDQTGDIKKARETGVIADCDILIIGGGITGCGIARALSKYNKSILVVEKKTDICEGTSKSNNGMIHSGYDSKPGSLKAKLCVKGNAMYTKWQEELNFKLNRTGSFIIGFDDEDDATIRDYYERGKANGVPGIAILSGDEAREIEPLISKEATTALWTPSAAYVEPYEVTEALMENAVDNGAKLMTETEVLAMDKDGDHITQVITNKGIIRAGCIINAAGLYADEIAKMAGDQFYTIHGRRGALIIMDKKMQHEAPKCFIGTAPKNFTKGGGPQTTPAGNPLWGPSALEVPDKEDTSVDPDDLTFILEKGKKLTPGISEKDIIRFFGGNRPANYVEDFTIEKSDILDNFIHVAGIQSPGIASAPAIDEMVENIYLSMYPDTQKDPNYNPIRKAKKAFRDCTKEEQEQLIQENPLYGHIICRCETVTEAEIVNAIHGKIPATTVDAVKRRTRAGMGRCQAGFCGPRVVEILARELGINEMDVTKTGGDSHILCEASRKGAAK